MRELHERMVSRLCNTELEHEPFLVCFSGVPLSGKTTMAKLLQYRYGMVRLRTDTVREVIGEMEEDLEPYAYVRYFLSNHGFPNHRIVVDASIDRLYEDVAAICEEQEIPMFVIRLPIPEDLGQRARERSGEEWEQWIDRMDKWKADYRRAGEMIDFDFVFEAEGGMKELMDELDALLRTN